MRGTEATAKTKTTTEILDSMKQVTRTTMEILTLRVRMTPQKALGSCESIGG